MTLARWQRALLGVAMACSALAASQLAFAVDPLPKAVERANPPADPAKPPADSATSSATFGFSCLQCEHVLPASCELMSQATIVAVVRGARVIESLGGCTPENPRPDYSSFCSSLNTTQFASVQFLRNALDAMTTDYFFSAYSFEYRKPQKKRGIALDPGKRYVIFAGKANPVVARKARWSIESACEVPADAPFPPP
jgi:hypothetical protein